MWYVMLVWDEDVVPDCVGPFPDWWSAERFARFIEDADGYNFEEVVVQELMHPEGFYINNGKGLDNEG